MAPLPCDAGAMGDPGTPSVPMVLEWGGCRGLRSCAAACCASGTSRGLVGGWLRPIIRGMNAATSGGRLPHGEGKDASAAGGRAAHCVGGAPCPVALRAFRVIRAEAELRPTLERARAVMAGTAEPPASEELDGALYERSFDFRRQTYYPDATRAEVIPIVVVDAEYDGDDEVVLTVRFSRAYYRADGSVANAASHSKSRWYLRPEDRHWMVYRVEDRLEG